MNTTDAMAALCDAETNFLRSSGWTERAATWVGRPVIRWVDPRSGDEMDKWVAVARLKVSTQFDAQADLKT